jgi:hypothetical protein
VFIERCFSEPPLNVEFLHGRLQRNFPNAGVRLLGEIAAELVEASQYWDAALPGTVWWGIQLSRG